MRANTKEIQKEKKIEKINKTKILNKKYFNQPLARFSKK